MNKPTRGISLVETLVMISVSATLTGVIVASIAALFRYDDAMTGHVIRQTNLQQMAHALRAEIHRATTCEWAQDSQSLRLRLPDNEQIEYRQQDSRWVRIVNTPDREPVTTPVGLDRSFHCEGRETVVQQGELIQLLWTNELISPQEAGDQTQRPLQYEIVAVVGHDHE